MAYFFGDSFDLYGTSSDLTSGVWDSGAAVFNFGLVTGRFTGSGRAVSLTSSVNVVKSSGQNDAIHHFSFAFQQTATLSGTTVGSYFQLGDSTTAQCSIWFRSDGAMLLCSGAPGGTVLATYAAAVTVQNTWFTYEVEIVIHNTAGSIAVRRNGSASNDFSATSLNTRGGTTNNYANRLTFGMSGNISSHYIDDLLWRSDPTSVPWVGDIRCYTRMPASDVSKQFTPSGTRALGYTGGGNVNWAGPNLARYVPFVAFGPGTLSAVTLTITTIQTVNYKCALFNDNAGQPGTVLATATNVVSNPSVGNALFTFSGVTLTAGQAFWVGFCDDANLFSSTVLVTGSTGGFSSLTTTYASFPQANPSSLSIIGQLNCALVYTSASSWPLVSDPQQDGTTSYVYSSNIGDTDLYSIQSISGSPASILAVTTRMLVQKSDAGSRAIAAVLKSGSTTSVGSGAVLGTTFLYVSRTDSVDPATGSAWTAAGVNNLQIGAQVTA